MSEEALNDHTDAVVGVYGKMPSRGDFVQRGLNSDFIGSWDTWLQECIAASKTDLGDRWLDAYLTSPIWRFALTENVIDESLWLGVMMPSVDKVNRYFPLTIAARAANLVNPFVILDVVSDWFENAENLLLHALDDDQLDIEDFAENVLAMGLPDWLAIEEPQNALYQPGEPLVLPVKEDLVLTKHLPDLLRSVLRQQFGQFTIWWTKGSEMVRPQLKIFGHLPDPGCYVQLLIDNDTGVKSTEEL